MGVVGQQPQGRQRGVTQSHVGQFVLVTVRIGLPQRRGHRESRPAHGLHRLVGDQSLQHGQGHRDIDTHDAEGSRYSGSPINAAAWSGT